eukprot:8861088-Pyramimonas_sp.AAC.2
MHRHLLGGMRGRKSTVDLFPPSRLLLNKTLAAARVRVAITALVAVANIGGLVEGAPQHRQATLQRGQPQQHHHQNLLAQDSPPPSPRPRRHRGFRQR